MGACDLWRVFTYIIIILMLRHFEDAGSRLCLDKSATSLLRICTRWFLWLFINENDMHISLQNTKLVFKMSIILLISFKLIMHVVFCDRTLLMTIRSLAVWKTITSLCKLFFPVTSMNREISSYIRGGNLLWYHMWAAD